jgi:hypothetical protein
MGLTQGLIHTLYKPLLFSLYRVREFFSAGRIFWSLAVKNPFRTLQSKAKEILASSRSDMAILLS